MEFDLAKIKKINIAMEQYAHFIALCLCQSKDTIEVNQALAYRKHITDNQKKYYTNNMTHHNGHLINLLSNSGLTEWSNIVDSISLGFFSFLKDPPNWKTLYEEKSSDVDSLYSCLFSSDKPEMSDDVKLVKDCYYQRIYPALKLIVDNMDDVWIRHGPEKICRMYKESDLYPIEHWSSNKDKDFWSIEVRKLPFYGTMPVQHNYFPWGVLPLSEFRKFNGKIEPMPNRDHCGAKAKIPLKNWIFLLSEDLPDYKVNEKHHELMKHSKGCIDHRVANQFLEIIYKVNSNLRAFND